MIRTSRASNRRLSDGPPPYRSPAPFRTFERRDAMPLVPGETAELVFDLLPTSYLFRAGHSIRVAVGGADNDHFFPLSGEAPQPRDASTAKWPKSMTVSLAVILGALFSQIVIVLVLSLSG